MAKYNSRMSTEEYQKIKTKAHERAVRDMYEKYYEPPKDSYKYQDLTPKEKKKLMKKAVYSMVRSSMAL